MSDYDDDSSDSSTDFSRAFTSKDELTASFFSIKSTKHNQVDSTKSNNKNDSDDDEDDDEDDDDFTTIAENNGNIELFSEVVKNLEAAQRIQVKHEDAEHNSSKDDSFQVFSFKDCSKLFDLVYN